LLAVSPAREFEPESLPQDVVIDDAQANAASCLLCHSAFAPAAAHLAIASWVWRATYPFG